MAGLGILGGTFDPVHNAHLAMARAALAHLALERVLFIPTGPTRYRDPANASGAERVAMLRLALVDEPRFAIDERELAPDASGYTVDTLRALRNEHPKAELHLLIGADQYAKLGSWHRPDEIKRLARIAVFARPGIQIEENVKLIPMQAMPISASEIRARVRRGAGLAGLVPPSVAHHIASRGLYR